MEQSSTARPSPVVLSAKSEDVVRRTHARYFYTTRQLLENLVRVVEEKLEPRPAK
jgi:hypothetical protein